MSKHDHHECTHQMAHCSPCNVAYCMACGLEWVSNHWMWYAPYWNTTTTTTDVGNLTVTTSLHDHGGS